LREEIEVRGHGPHLLLSPILMAGEGRVRGSWVTGCTALSGPKKDPSPNLSRIRMGRGEENQTGRVKN
jgi:hypothetical protein